VLFGLLLNYSMNVFELGEVIANLLPEAATFISQVTSDEFPSDAFLFWL
jgi:hypothetical protein